MKLETDNKIQLLRETIAEVESRIQLIEIGFKGENNETKEHLEILAKNIRLMVIDILKDLNK